MLYLIRYIHLIAFTVVECYLALMRIHYKHDALLAPSAEKFSDPYFKVSSLSQYQVEESGCKFYSFYYSLAL